MKSLKITMKNLRDFLMNYQEAQSKDVITSTLSSTVILKD
jgi:hypothetical protein